MKTCQHIMVTDDGEIWVYLLDGGLIHCPLGWAQLFDSTELDLAAALHDSDRVRVRRECSGLSDEDWAIVAGEYCHFCGATWHTDVEECPEIDEESLAIERAWLAEWRFRMHGGER